MGHSTSCSLLHETQALSQSDVKKQRFDYMRKHLQNTHLLLLIKVVIDEKDAILVALWS